MKLALVGDGHPLAAALKDLLPQAQLHPWAAPADPPDADALVLLPPLWPTEPADVEAVLDDLDVAHRWLQPWVPVVRERGGASLLYVVHMDGICGTAGNVLLAERDSAFLAQARAMAMELGRFGVRSNCLALGPLAAEASASAAGDGPLSQNPLRRTGTYAEAAKTAAFLIGEASAHVTGQLLVCAGGADVGRVQP